VATAPGRVPQYADMISGLYTRGSPSVLVTCNHTQKGQQSSDGSLVQVYNQIQIIKELIKISILWNCVQWT
jgi:hypothetical protein